MEIGAVGTSVVKRTWRDVLLFSPTKVSQSTIRRYYEQYRREMDLPFRCDNETCTFHKQPPIWNGKPLPLILDHKNGVRQDNSPKNLRLLCPNCDAQLFTRGGGNKGRVAVSDAGYRRATRDGKFHYTLVATAGYCSVSGGAAELRIVQTTSLEADA
jgi:hypothetical protein